MKNKVGDSNLAAWLGDLETENRNGLLEALDDLYRAGPGVQATARARSKLRRAMKEARRSTVYYGGLAGTPVGNVFVGLSERGLVDLAMGLTEEQFLARLEKRTGMPAERAPGRANPALHQLEEYFDRRRERFDLKIDLSATTDFRRRVLQEAQRIPFGRVVSYGEIARKLGKRRAARAVGQALAHNPVPIVIPCHRVLGSDGTLKGYSGTEGVRTKAKLLKLEGVIFD